MRWIASCALVVVVFALGGAAAVSASVITGPIINPANGHSYTLLASDSWSASENEAVALGGHLVTINDAAENQWVFDTFSSYGGVSRDLWIGLTDSASEGDFNWTNGDPVVFTNWQNLQPDDFGSIEDYAHIYSGGASEHIPGWTPGKWNDYQNLASYRTSSGTTRRLYGVVEVVPPAPSPSPAA